MRKAMPFLLPLSILFTILLLIPGTTFANDEMTEINVDNTTIYVDHYTDQVDGALDIEERSLNSSNVDLSGSYSSPRLISAYTESPSFWLRLMDSNRNPVTGIKVSRIEMIQNNIVVARSNDVESFSIKGEYLSANLGIINSFENSNGENLVDMVLYLGSKEVARIKNFKISIYEQPIVERITPTRIGLTTPKFSLSATMLNVDKDTNIDAYLVDKDGNRITKTDKIIRDGYKQNEKKRSIDYGISFIDEKYQSDSASYEYIIEVDGQKIAGYNNHQTRIVSNPFIDTTYHAYMPNLEYWVTGVNLLGNNPYKLVIEQEGIITKEINNVQAVFNESEYEEEIKVNLLPEYFTNYGGMYKVSLYDANHQMLMDFEDLVPKDDTSKEENDEVDPLEGFKVFDKKENVEPTKTWKVKFNEALDSNTINKGNTYITHKSTGQLVEVDYSFENAGTVLVMTPEKDFISGETYTLMIDKRVKSSAGANLKQPAAIEFTVR